MYIIHNVNTLLIARWRVSPCLISDMTTNKMCYSERSSESVMKAYHKIKHTRASQTTCFIIKFNHNYGSCIQRPLFKTSNVMIFIELLVNSKKIRLTGEWLLILFDIYER